MKKFILGLGTVASTVAPVAAVVACGIDSETGNPILSAEESTELVKAFGLLLGIDTTSIKAGSLQIKFTNATTTGIEFTLERTSADTASSIAIANLEKSGTALAFVKGEILKFNLEYNADKTGLKTKTFTLSGSSTKAKNGEYIAKTGTLSDANIITILKIVLKKALGINETITLDSTALQALKTRIGTVPDSASAIFANAAGIITTPSFTNVKSATLIAKVNLKNIFDFTFELTGNTGGFVINTKGGEFITVAEDAKVTIHLIGTVTVDKEKGATYKVASNEVTLGNTKTKLASTGAQTLAEGLYYVSNFLT